MQVCFYIWIIVEAWIVEVFAMPIPVMIGLYGTIYW